MFGQMMSTIAQDFVRYVMHVQVVMEQETVNRVRDITVTSSDTVETDGFIEAARAGGDVDPELVARVEEAAHGQNKPFVRDAEDWSKTPRNAPCPCGSGRKYKQCHGAA